LDAAKARRFAAMATARLRQSKTRSGTVILPSLGGKMTEIGQALTEGAILGDYRFLKYRSKDRDKHREEALESIVFMAVDGRQAAGLRQGFRAGLIHSRATVFARDLVNEPASVVTPTYLADLAAQVAKDHPKRIECRIFDDKALADMGAGGILAVGRGSDEPSFMVHLTFRPSKKAKRRLVLIGKGLTFDAGGLSLKPSEGMADMKIDMAGAAAVLGAFSVIAELSPQVEVHGIIGLCENMPSGKAVRPGDIVRTLSGKTVEILNTDAEGRVVLADCLHYAQGLKPDYAIDLATLTGACMVALGQEYAGLMSDDSRLVRKLAQAAGEAGELVWRLPLAPEYGASLQSKFADLKNIAGGRYGGAITAGLFLKEFAGEMAWAHLDIAGPAWAEKETVPHQPLGGTGFGVRTVLRFIQKT
jgi:leucyl aminopeptidase